MITGRKWKSLYKALNNIVRDKRDFKNYITLKGIMYKDGAIYATDTFVAVKVEFAKPLQVSVDDVELDPCEGKAYEIYEDLHIREGNCTMPDFDNLWLEEGAEQLHCFNPRLMIEVCDVFKVFDLNPVCKSNGLVLDLSAQNSDVSIHAVLMGCRV